MSNVADSGEEHSMIWGMFMAATMNAETFMGKNFSTIQNLIMNSKDFILKQMFDITAKLVGEEEKINNLDNIHWRKFMETTVIDWWWNSYQSSAHKSLSSQILLLIVKTQQHPESNEALKKRIEWIATFESYRDYDGISGEPTEFEWNIFPGFTTLQFCGKVIDLLSSIGQIPETISGRILSMSILNDISCNKKAIKKNVWQMPESVSICKEIWYWTIVIYLSRFWKEVVFSGRDWPTRNLGSYRGRNTVGIRRKRMSIFRVTTPLLLEENSRAKDTEDCRYILLLIIQHLRPFFAYLFYANQLSFYGAVANMCEECESFHDRLGQLDMVMGHWIVLWNQNRSSFGEWRPSKS